MLLFGAVAPAYNALSGREYVAVLSRMAGKHEISPAGLDAAELQWSWLNTFVYI
jgi:hypothetical protein